MLWITDGGHDAERAATIVDVLKHELDCDTVMVICFRPSAAPVIDRTPYDQLRLLASPDPDRETPYHQVTLLLSPHSSLVHALGPEYQQALVSRTLAAMLLAGAQKDSSPTFASVVGAFADQGLPFATLALDSTGLKGDEQERWYRRVIRTMLHPRSHPPFRYETIYQRCIGTTQKLMEGHEGTTSLERLDRQRTPTYVSYLVPMRRRDRRIGTLKAALSAYLSAEYQTPQPIIARADGIDVSSVRPHSRGDYYYQTGILYGFDQIETKPPTGDPAEGYAGSPSQYLPSAPAASTVSPPATSPASPPEAYIPARLTHRTS